MLRKFAVTNYRGFSKRIELDLSSPSNFEYNSFAIKDKIVKDLMIYGPNGSGKSNIGFAMFDIVVHLTQKERPLDLYLNFSSGGSLEPVVFEYEFQFGKDILRYSYSKNNVGQLLTENLSVSDSILIDKRIDKVYFNPDFFTIQQSASDDFLRQANNVSALSYLMISYPLTQDSPVYKLVDFVNRMLWFRCLEYRGYIGFENGLTPLETYIIEKGLIDDFKAFLFTVSGQSFKFKKPVNGEKILYCVISGKYLPFNSVASTGTHSLTLLYYWLTKMSNASLVFIDEFDAFYHYELSYEVCKRLFNIDPQVLLTTHNTALMTNDLLRPDCYFLIDGKNIKPLVQCTAKELRVGHNLEKLYRGKGFIA